MNISNIITALCSILFFMIGADKFLGFMEPPCSLEGAIQPWLWSLFGVLQIAAGVLIWVPTTRRFVLWFFVLFMVGFSIFHLSKHTYDIGGAMSMAAMMGMLLWNPNFIQRKFKVKD